MIWGIEQGARLAQYRARKNYTQVDVAGKLGRSKQAVWMYEHGKRKPTQALLGAMADLYEVPVEEITGTNTTTTQWKPLVEHSIKVSENGIEVGDFVDEKTDELLMLMCRLRGMSRAELLQEAIRLYAERTDWQELIRNYYMSGIRHTDIRTSPVWRSAAL